MNEKEAEETGAFLQAIVNRLENLARDIDKQCVKIVNDATALELKKNELREVKQELQAYFGLQKD